MQYETWLEEVQKERNKKMAKASSKVSSSVGRGRPQSYPLTPNQVRMIRTRLGREMSVAKIAAELGVHEFAVLRIKRGSEN